MARSCQQTENFTPGSSPCGALFLRIFSQQMVVPRERLQKTLGEDHPRRKMRTTGDKRRSFPDVWFKSRIVSSATFQPRDPTKTFPLSHDKPAIPFACTVSHNMAREETNNGTLKRCTANDMHGEKRLRTLDGDIARATMPRLSLNKHEHRRDSLITGSRCKY